MAQLKDLLVIGPSTFLEDINGVITKAKADEDGNNIKASYASNISISDHTIALKNKNGSNLTTITIPDSDTMVNVSARGTTKAYLLATTTQPNSTASAQTAVAESGVYLDTSAATLVTTNLKVGDTIEMGASSIKGILDFKRDGANYILFPHTSGKILFGEAVGGTIYYSLSSTFFKPYQTETIDLGLSSERWKTLYAKSGDFSSGGVVLHNTLPAGTDRTATIKAETLTNIANRNYILPNFYDSVNTTSDTWLVVSGKKNAVGSTTQPVYINASGIATPITTLSISNGGTGTSTASQNYVFAGPVSSASGTPSFRALVAGDIPVISTSKITSGTFSVERGGTGCASLDSGKVLIGNGTSAVTFRDIYTRTTKGDLEWSDATSPYLLTKAALVYWDGSFNGTASNITKVGTITSGTWNGTTIAVNKGGTGHTSFTENRLIFSPTSTTFENAAKIYVKNETNADAYMAINKTSITSGYTFEVNGTSLLKNLDLSNNLTLSNLASHKNHLICSSDANGTIGITNYIYTTQQDEDGVIIPHINNDLAFLLSRNGTVDFHIINSSSVTDNTFIDSTISGWSSFSIQESDKRKLFNGSLNYYTVGSSGSASTYLIIDIKCPTEHPSEQQFRYYNYFYIDFYADQYNVKNIWLYTKNGESSNYSLVDKIQDNTNGYWNSTILNNSGFTHLRIVLNTWTTCRIAQIGLITHNSMGARGPFMSRGEDDLIYRNLTPGNPSGSAQYDIGSSTNRWNDIYGNLKGNADTATGIDPNVIDSSITNNETINNGLIYLKNSNGEKQFQCSSLTKINAQGLKVETTTNSNLEYQLANNVAKINLRIDSSGNRGLYDPTSGGNWLLLINSNNAVRIKNFTSYYEFMPVAKTGKILGKKGSSTQSWMILAQYSNVQTPGWYMVTVSVLAGSGGQTYWGGIVPWISANGAEEGYRILNNYNIDGNTSAYAGVELQFYRRHKTYGACFILQNHSTTDILTVNHNTKITLQYIAPYTNTFYSYS